MAKKGVNPFPPKAGTVVPPTKGGKVVVPPKKKGK